MTSLRCVALGILVVLAAFSSGQNPKYTKVHEGTHWIWYARSDQFLDRREDIAAVYDYADEAFEALESAWGIKAKEAKYNLFVWDKTGGGFATGDIGEVHGVTGRTSPGIACSYDAFSNVAHNIKGYWAPVLITHEMVNLFTGTIVGGGWPRDWWADDRSPFPFMTSVEIELQLIPQTGIDHLSENSKDPQLKMFRKMKDQYGWEMFRRAFQMAIDDGINWDRLGGNPSPLRTNYVAAYLEMGARADLSSMMSGPVPGYDHSVVKGIINARSLWLAHAKDSGDYKSARDAYLSGRFFEVR